MVRRQPRRLVALGGGDGRSRRRRCRALPLRDGARRRGATASFSVHATTDAVARGRGVFVELERKHEQEATERGVACVLAFASAPTIPLFLGPLGWTEIGKLRVWARPVSSKASGEVTRLLDVEGDPAASWPNHIVRSAEYLRWRYLDSPRGYEAVRSDGGYADRVAGEAAPGP